MQYKRTWVISLMMLLVMAAVAPLAAVKARRARKKSDSPVVSRAQREMAQQMVRDSYKLGRSLELPQRVALMTRLLYTMRPEVMAEEKEQWASELFTLAQQLPPEDSAGPDSPRNAAIATAAARVAVYNAERALELLDSLPEETGSHAGPRVMAARLVFNGYMAHHGADAAQVLLAHGRRWSEHGGFPYAASAIALARLRPNEDAAEAYFRQELAIFSRGQEGVFGIRDFASLLEQAVAMEAISEDSAEEAGREVIRQLRKFADDQADAVPASDLQRQERRLAALNDVPLTADQKLLVMDALNDVRLSAPKAHEAARRLAPGLFAVRAARVEVVAAAPRVDAGLESAFHDLADSMRDRRSSDATREVVNRGLRLINQRYQPGACPGCSSPDAQSWALVALAAHAAPMTIGSQLRAIDDPFWRAYFLAIAAQQVGQPTRVADPTARKLPGKEEAEPE